MSEFGKWYDIWSPSQSPHNSRYVQQAFDAGRASLDAEVAQLKTDIEYATDARLQDAKDNKANFKTWKKERHDPLVAEVAELKRQLAEMQADLQHISEYWNRSENDRSMNDALYHILEVADAAISKPNHGSHLLERIANAESEREERIVPKHGGGECK